MAATAIDTTARIIDLSDAAYQSFCDGISSMFGADVRCDRKQAGVGTAGQLQAHFKKLTAVHLINADGAMTGTLHVVFDQAGLFILSGVVIMLPEGRILEQVKRGSMENTESLQDAAREVGNLMVGSWDTVFREQCKGHRHFVKKDTFIGKLWEKPGQMQLSPDDQVLLALYEMTVEPYPSFTCAAVIPKSMLAGIDSESVEHAGQAPSQQEPASEPQPGTVAPQVPVTDGNGKIEEHGAAKSPDAGSPPRPPADPARDAPPAAAVREAVSQEPDMAPSPVTPAPQSRRPDHGLAELLRTPAAKIMERDVVWAGPEDTVQAVLAKMQQHNAGYVLIGQNGTLEGLVSNSNILGAVSVYLRPVFAKWRRPEDDATLGVKVKWIMSRPVRTIRPDTTLEATIESMRRCGGRCLPVADEKGAVQGIVTTFEILLYLLRADASVSWQGKPPQAPAMLL